MGPSESRRMRGLSAWLGTGRSRGWLILTLAALVIGAAGVWQVYRSGEQRVEQLASRLADAAAADVERGVEQLDLILQTVMRGEQTPASQRLTQEQRDALLSERTPHDRFVAFLDVLDPNGNVLARLNQSDPATNWANQEYFRTLRDNPTIDRAVGLPFSTGHEDSAGFTLARRITAPNGKFGGVVVIGFRLAAFRDTLGRHDLDASGSVMLLRTDGTVLVRLPFDPRDVGHSLRSPAPFEAFVRSGKPTFSEHGMLDGIDTFFLFRRVSGFPLAVGVTIPLEESASGAYVYWLLAGAVALAAGCWLFLRRLWHEQRSREAAEHQSEEKSRFLTMLSHELRTPLHGVLGYADELSREGMLTPAQTRRVAEIVRSAKHMRDVVNVVLDYARVEALGPTLHMRRFDVGQLVEECLAVIEPSARARGLAVRCVARAKAPTHFVGDDVQLRQILVNLLSNAVKYTPCGSIELRLSGDQEHLRIEVIDTGIGIPEGQRHHLFQEYERFGTERTCIEGTGLGLAIAHRLARHMGGHLGHRNNPAGGSVFWVEVPAGTADEPALAVEGPEVASAPGLSVLIVDDSDVSRDVTAAFLRNAGQTVTEARDGSEAVRLAGSADFDVVLMDMRMAGMDGLEATRRIRSLGGPRAAVPIVAVTANALDRDAEECRRAGMTQHLAKPFTQAELLAVVSRAVQAGRSGEPVVDPDAVEQLAGCMGHEAVEQLLDRLAPRIEAVLRKLEDPTGSASHGELAELAHELAGSGGTLGFIRLAAAARRFQAASDLHLADPADLKEAALAALSELRRRRSLEAMLCTT
jgi:signal transduction histidine kinase/DNA-binding response OmpR family regulator